MQQQKEEPPIEPINIEAGIYKVPDAAKRLGMSERALWDRIQRREIAVVRSGRYLRITDKQIEQFIEANTVGAQDIEAFTKKLIKNRKPKTTN